MARKILLADDSVTAQNMGRKILTDAGYEVVTVNNGSAAIKKIADIKPDLIVLDVYMPGYSGLEVCQRVKENRETSQLPVLLTVGKLEPFKQDEARRVRADAFIIKPFEATELLAVLGKLEDKLVAPGTPKVTRFAPNTMESFERKVRDGLPKYGDEDSGWKARLKIPADAPRITEAESAVAAPVTPAFRDLVPATANQADANSTVVAAPELPADITPDEVAALAAAMTRIKAGESPESVKVSEATSPDATPDDSERPASSIHLASEASTESPEAYAGPDISEPATLAHAQNESSEEASGPAFMASVSESSVATASPAEIEAALASISAVTPDPAAPSGLPAIALAATQDSSTFLTPVVTGPRWIAEEVPVDAAESVLVLEREMQKAYAAFAAAEHAASFYRYEPAPVDRDDEPAFAAAPEPIGSPVPLSELASANVPDTSESQTDSAARHGFRDLAADPPKPPAPPFAASATASAGEIGVAAFGTPQPFGVGQAGSPSEPVSNDQTSRSLVADASASGPEGSATAAADHISLTESIDNRADQLPVDSQTAREAEIAAATAAAWASWRDIRESLVNAKAASGDAQDQTPDTADIAPQSPEAELELIRTLKDLKSGPPGSEPTKSDLNSNGAQVASGTSENRDPSLERLAADTAAEPEKPSEIASIVDSMLAELRPKLVAEIAKKLAKKNE